MSRYYTGRAIQELAAGYDELHERCFNLQERLVSFDFTNDTAKEYARHGLARRLKILLRCIENVFEILPPDLEIVPSMDDTQDGGIQMQAFIINAFGCLDNLAWIWVSERIVLWNGQPLRPEWVGLRPNNTAVRESLGRDLCLYLDEFEPWLKYLESYRHALAHRIPLYIPPFAIDPEHISRYEELESSIMIHTRRGQIREAEQLKAEQADLMFFRPCMLHTWSEAKKTVMIHAQLLADFRTVEEISGRVLDELAGQT